MMAIRNHYVPQAYLKGFGEPASPEYVWIFDKKSGRLFRSNVTNAAVETGFYSADVEETLNDEIEIPANRVLHKLRNRQALELRDKLDLATYIAVMWTRVPRHRERQAELIPGVREGVFGELEEKLNFVKMAHPELADAAVNRLAEVARLKEEYRKAIPSSLLVEIQIPRPSQRVVEHLLSMTWRFTIAEGALSYLTSDNPVFIFEALGVGRPESEVSFPVCSDLALVVSWEPPKYFDCEYIEVKQQLVKEVNRRTVRSATRFLFYHRQESWVGELAQKSYLRLNRVLWSS